MLVDVTKDVTGAKYEYTACAPAEITPKTDTIKDEDIATAVQMIKEAKRPFIFTGGGTIISEASREVTELAHRIDAPVCDSLMGKEDFPEKILCTQECLECMGQKLPILVSQAAIS